MGWACPAQNAEKVYHATVRIGKYRKGYWHYRCQLHTARSGVLHAASSTVSFQGNVQILHDGEWGAICDDEWAEAEAEIACKELGFSRGAIGPTHSSQFGYSPRIIWMDNGTVGGPFPNSHPWQQMFMRNMV